MSTSYYTVATLARFVGVSERTIERWWVAGKLPTPTIRESDGAKCWSAAQARKVLDERRTTKRGGRHGK